MCSVTVSALFVPSPLSPPCPPCSSVTLEVRLICQCRTGNTSDTGFVAFYFAHFLGSHGRVGLSSLKMIICVQSTLRCRICVCFPPDFYSLANIVDRLKTAQGILSCMNRPLALAKTCCNFYAFCSMPAHAHWPYGNCRACSGYGRWGNMMPCPPWHGPVSAACSRLQ